MMCQACGVSLCMCTVYNSPAAPVAVTPVEKKSRIQINEANFLCDSDSVLLVSFV
jgi:hypothetical protein